MDCVAVDGESRFHHGLAEGGVGVDVATHLPGIALEQLGQRRLRDELGRGGSDHVTAEELAWTRVSTERDQADCPGTDSAPAVRLGDGTSEGLSPDGKWVLSIPRNRTPAQITMLPTGTGEPRQITHDRLNHRNARWMPDGSHIFFQGNEERQAPRLWIQALDGSAPRAISPENVAASQVTPDGRFILGRAPDRKFYLYPVVGGAPVAVPVLKNGDVPTRFSLDGRSLFVATFGKIPAILFKVDLATGARSEWREAMPADPAGLINVGPILVTPDGATTVYSYTRLLSDLYIVSTSAEH